ncbi:MAG: hypothetical protein DCC75_01320 [Proteobacteria bacterium]|nr:MAG: hypothetical protein DCC75_01320 [Pseudomonadota bacterium]
MLRIALGCLMGMTLAAQGVYGLERVIYPPQLLTQVQGECAQYFEGLEQVATPVSTKRCEVTHFVPSCINILADRAQVPYPAQIDLYRFILHKRTLGSSGPWKAIRSRRVDTDYCGTIRFSFKLTPGVSKQELKVTGKYIEARLGSREKAGLSGIAGNLAEKYVCPAESEICIALFSSSVPGVLSVKGRTRAGRHLSKRIATDQHGAFNSRLPAGTYEVGLVSVNGRPGNEFELLSLSRFSIKPSSFLHISLLAVKLSDLE